MKHGSGRPDTWIDKLTRETVIVHCKHDGPSFKGILSATHSDCVVLSDALLLEADRQALTDGEVVVLRENVSFLQVIAP